MCFLLFFCHLGSVCFSRVPSLPLHLWYLKSNHPHRRHPVPSTSDTVLPSGWSSLHRGENAPVFLFFQTISAKACPVAEIIPHYPAGLRRRNGAVSVPYCSAAPKDIVLWCPAVVSSIAPYRPLQGSDAKATAITSSDSTAKRVSLSQKYDIFVPYHRISSSRHTAWQERPSNRPVKPNPSSVVAFTFIRSMSTDSCMAIFSCI